MPQIQIVGPSRSSLVNEELGRSLGQGLGQFASQYYANKSLENVLQDPTLKKAPVSQRLSKLASSMQPHGEIGQKLFEGQLMAEKQKVYEQQQELAEREKQKQLEEQEILGKFGAGEPITAEDRKKLTPKTQIELQKLEKNKKQASNMKDALIKANVPSELADQFSGLYESATEGGKTELLKNFNELLKRGKTGYFKEYNKENILNPDVKPEDLEWPEIEQPQGMTPSEEVKLQGTREGVNSKIYEDLVTKIQGHENEERAVSRLNQLNESKKIPEGLEKWDIDWQTGEPRFSPGTLNPETQLFLKTINDYTVKAKDAFPGKVTNFDLERFMKRLPTLANSTEGRRLILKQMELTNQIANLKDTLLRDAFDHYSLGGASNQQIRKVANDKYKKQKEVLENRLKDLDGLLDDEYTKESMKPKEQNVPQGNVKVKTPNGVPGYLPQEQLDEALRKGYERIE